MSHLDAENLVVGTEVAGYEIQGELGRGSMAVVYRAIQKNLDRPVAFKVLTRKLASNEEFVGRFFNEARAAASLTHPNIVQAYDAGIVDDNIYYFAMELVKGETLLDRIERKDKISLEDGLGIALHIASVLAYGWDHQQLTHGDIKPENIMLNQHGQAKLADFGLAKVVGHDYDGDGVMLTPHYGAPELIRGRNGEQLYSADIYSFGATLYHMFAGNPTFLEDDPQKVMKLHLYDDVKPLHKVQPAIPVPLSKFIGKMLEKHAEDRPESWDEVVEKLQEFSDEVIGKSRSYLNSTDAEVVRVQRRSLLLRLSFIALLIAMIFGIWKVIDNNKNPKPSGVIVEQKTIPEREWEKLKADILDNKSSNHDTILAKLTMFAKMYSTKEQPAEFKECLKEYQKNENNSDDTPDPKKKKI